MLASAGREGCLHKLERLWDKEGCVGAAMSGFVPLPDLRTTRTVILATTVRKTLNFPAKSRILALTKSLHLRYQVNNPVLKHQGLCEPLAKRSMRELNC